MDRRYCRQWASWSKELKMSVLMLCVWNLSEASMLHLPQAKRVWRIFRWEWLRLWWFTTRTWRPRLQSPRSWPYWWGSEVTVDMVYPQHTILGCKYYLYFTTPTVSRRTWHTSYAPSNCCSYRSSLGFQVAGFSYLDLCKAHAIRINMIAITDKFMESLDYKNIHIGLKMRSYESCDESKSTDSVFWARSWAVFFLLV